MTNAGLTVAVTGAAGSLGGKAITALATSGAVRRIIAIDQVPSAHPSFPGCEVETCLADLCMPNDCWTMALGSADALFHLAARNPFPNASWQDARASFDMTTAVLWAGVSAGVRRLILAFFNNVMGGYKNDPLSATISPGGLTEMLPPGPGTSWHAGGRRMTGTAYAASKLFSESAFLTWASPSARVICLRIGWRQPGVNHPDTITADGLLDANSKLGPEQERDLRWFRNLWLSDRDFAQIVRLACTASLEHNTTHGLIVNAMSDNADMAWSLDAARRQLGYRPLDNIWAWLSDASGLPGS